MNSFQIRYFLVLCEELNYAKASERLNITQQGLSKSIKALEAEVGVPLFIKNDRRVALTSYGEYARNRLSVVLNNIESIKQELAQMKDSKRKIISFAILEGYCKDRAFTLEDLLGAPPAEMKMVPHICTFEEGVRMLEEEIVDVFVTKGPISHRRLKAINTTYEHFFAVVPTADELSEKPRISISDLRNKKLIIFNEKYKFYSNFFAKCEKYGFVPELLNTADEVSAIFLPCILGEGIGIVPEFSIKEELKNIAQIKIVPFEEEMDEQMCFAVLEETVVPKPIRDYISRWIG